MTPDEAFLLVLAGTLGIYCEFVWPGRVFPGAAGCVLAAAGIRAFAHMQLNGAGVVLIAGAVALFLVEAFWGLDFLAGVAGAISLATGFSLLVRGPARIPPALAAPTCLCLGSLTVLLCYGAKRARRNKWSDLG